VITISFDAVVPPSGALFAMSTIGSVAVRAPSTPSKLSAPFGGSKIPQPVNVATVRGFSNVLPPSNERS